VLAWSSGGHKISSGGANACLRDYAVNGLADATRRMIRPMARRQFGRAEMIADAILGLRAGGLPATNPGGAAKPVFEARNQPICTHNPDEWRPAGA